MASAQFGLIGPIHHWQKNSRKVSALKMSPSNDWRSIAAVKRAAAFEHIPKAWRLPNALLEKYNSTIPETVLTIPRDYGILYEKQLQITEQYHATALAEMLANREFTAVAVISAFSKRAVIAQQLVRDTRLHIKTDLLTLSDEVLDRDLL